MGRRHRGPQLTIGLFLAVVMLVAGPAASAFGFAKVRLVNARPGSHPIGLKVVVGGAAPPSVGPASYAQVTPYARVSAGSAQISLSGLQSSDGTPNQVKQDLVDGANYTAVALAKGSKGFELKLYRDGHARKGTARLRVIHAAPELGSPDIKLGQRTVAEKLAFKEATPYLSQAPGSYDVAVVRPGSSTPIFQKTVALSAGVATTAILAGSGGARERLISATDDTVTPAGAPGTGLGGLAGHGGPPWVLIALAAGLAGALGGAWQLALARRTGRR
ncbi:MAG: hypothetical protein QOF65_1896 [Thermoleophilaceae bacterium]|nr:hypothetical protein [Thermoleophilaceae bacterium]